MTGQDPITRAGATVTVEFLEPWDLVIADTRTREPVAGPFVTVEGARDARFAMADPGHMMVTTAAWLLHLASTPARCGSGASPITHRRLEPAGIVRSLAELSA